MNPVIPGFHPDPSICRVGDDYYLACSSFEYFPGIPIFHSRDLVRWTQIGNVMEQPLSVEVPSSAGVYAPTIRHHDGRFWLIVTIMTVEGPVNVLFNSTDPAGPWSDPVRLPGVPGIDPDLAWDEDDGCWVTFAGMGQVRIDPWTGENLAEPREVWNGTPGALAPEAPHLYRVGDHWYLMIAEGGTERGHAVSIARGPAPDGPFEPCPANPILTHRGTHHPVQNTGHADLVQAADGSWWMVFLAVRPRGGTPGWHVLGRETFLAPVSWVDGWPVVGEIVSGVPAGPFRDDFDLTELQPSWISVRSRPRITKERPDWLTLHARGASLDERDVAFLGHRAQHLRWRARTLIDPSHGRGGLAVRLDERHHYEIEAGDGRVQVIARIGSVRSVVAEHAVTPAPMVLTVETGEPRVPGDACAEPDTLSFGIEGSPALAILDGRYLSTEVTGGFTGRVIGMYAATGAVHFDWFDYEEL
ncbi:glycoside hydrolase family 43 protein [Nonomuraea sp. CA-141351]|uniref:glycoside hydrolase family 43 protein n=1 Tax=Nonomuraea sp. CA-141351 TaxID=3239996 RepID=UPI003D89BB9D